MSLSDLAVRNARPKARPYKISDGEGLYLLVQTNGVRCWRMDYGFLGKRKTLAFGVYPTVSLAAARAKRMEAKKQLSEGIDPSHQRKLDKLAALMRGRNTFRAVAEDLLDKMTREGKASTTIEKTRWLFELVYLDIGERPIAEITAPEMLIPLRRVEARGRYETARRLRSTCGMVFRLAIATGRADRDPTPDLRGALVTPKPKHRAAIVEPKAIGALLRAIDGYDGYAPARYAMQLLALTFVRPGELRHAEWSEFDMDAAVWTLPPVKMKMRRPHRVPLSTQALAVVRKLQPISANGGFLFPSIRTMRRPISENTMNAALRRLGYGPDDVSPHGFRAMAAVRLNEMGQWNPDAIERQLAHQEANDVRRAYTHAAEFWTERVRMMQAWADYLDTLRQGADIVPIRRLRG